MKTLTFYIISLMIFPISASWSQPGEPYFGEPFPTITATQFAPDIFTEELHAPPIFSPDGTEVYWNWMSTEPRNIQYMKLIDGIWTQPASVPFGFEEGSDSPFISSDGTKLVFLWGHFSGAAGPGKVCIVEKSNGEWMSPQILGNEVNQNGAHWQASMADNQNLYFGTEGDIYFSEYVNGEYTTAEMLGTNINTNVYEGCPFIAPDESYLIFDRTMPNLYADIFICCKQDDGSWGDPINMEELNGTYHEMYANVSPDGRFIMFLSNSYGGELLPYWVDAQIINNYITIGIDEKKKMNPNLFQLHQNSPNPFRLNTKIEFTLNKAAKVLLKIIDTEGKDVKTLLNKKLYSGTHSISWNAKDTFNKNVNPGVYYYQLTCNSVSVTKQMVLME